MPLALLYVSGEIRNFRGSAAQLARRNGQPYLSASANDRQIISRQSKGSVGPPVVRSFRYFSAG